MKTKYLLLEFAEPMSIDTDKALRLVVVGNAVINNGEKGIVDWAHTFETPESTDRMKRFLANEEDIGAVEIKVGTTRAE